MCLEPNYRKLGNDRKSNYYEWIAHLSHWIDDGSRKEFRGCLRCRMACWAEWEHFAGRCNAKPFACRYVWLSVRCAMKTNSTPKVTTNWRLDADATFVWYASRLREALYVWLPHWLLAQVGCKSPVDTNGRTVLAATYPTRFHRKLVKASKSRCSNAVRKSGKWWCQ